MSSTNLLTNFTITPLWAQKNDSDLVVANVENEGLVLQENKKASNQLWNLNLVETENGLAFNIYCAKYGREYAVYDKGNGNQITMVNPANTSSDNSRFDWIYGGRAETGTNAYYIDNLKGAGWIISSTAPKAGDTITMEPGTADRNLFVFTAV